MSTPPHIPESQIPGPPRLPNISPQEAIDTLPASARLPTDSELAKPDRDEANWQFVRVTLSSVAENTTNIERRLERLEQERASFRQHLDDQLSELKRFQEEFGSRSDGRWNALNERIGALDNMLIGRFDASDERIDEVLRQLAALNQIVAGIRSLSKSSFEMISTVRRSSIPDANADESTEHPSAHKLSER